MAQHRARLRPVTRDPAGEWRALPLLREAWQSQVSRHAVVWMLWCETCGSVVPGTAMRDTVGCDLDDLVARWTEVREWQARCQAMHQATLEPRQSRHREPVNENGDTPALVGGRRLGCPQGALLGRLVGLAPR